jgi:hypothetical protein
LQLRDSSRGSALLTVSCILDSHKRYYGILFDTHPAAIAARAETEKYR